MSLFILNEILRKKNNLTKTKKKQKPNKNSKQINIYEKWMICSKFSKCKTKESIFLSFTYALSLSRFLVFYSRSSITNHSLTKKVRDIFSIHTTHAFGLFLLLWVCTDHTNTHNLYPCTHIYIRSFFLYPYKIHKSNVFVGMCQNLTYFSNVIAIGI